MSEMCCVVVDRYMAGSLHRLCVPIHEYPIFFFFLFLSLAGPVGCALGYDDLLFLFGCVCGCRSCGVVFWCIGGCVVVAGRVDTLCTLSTDGLYRGSSLMTWKLMIDKDLWVLDDGA